ncbi:MAG TPA: hypothetical protein VMM92_14360, partial [Thermoanaerobaculia bacterium]|nr:hypothetical protein [Thermoanaerobaculia bacterium]
MYDHPSAGSFTSFLLGELSQGEVKSIVAHLARGCPSCEQQIEALSRELFGEGSKGPAAGTSGDPEYDAAIDRAFAAAVAVATAERDIRPLHRELLSRAG